MRYALYFFSNANAVASFNFILSEIDVKSLLIFFTVSSID